MPAAKYREAYASYGACTNCGARPAKANRRCCQDCISRAAARAIAQLRARRESGCCAMCGATSERWYCADCRSVRAAKARVRRAQREVTP